MDLKRVGLVLVSIIASVRGGMGVLADSTPPAVATLTLAKARYLSTESPTGLLDVKNTSAVALSFYSTSVVFLIRDPNGSVREDPWIRTVSLLRPFIIGPGKQITISLPLPKCEVASDACSEHVSVQLSVTPKDGKEVVLTTSEQSYTFEPDPTATFEVDGLAGNRPLFITQGDARSTIPPLGTAANSPWFPQQENPFAPLISQADENARNSASQLAAFLAAGALDDASGLSGDDTLLRFSTQNSDALTRSPWVTTDDLIFDNAVKQRLVTAANLPLSVDVRSTRGFAGANVAVPHGDTFGTAPQRSEYFGQNMRDPTWMSLTASVAADRPEVFAVVQVRRQDCDSFGYDCRAVAFELAHQRAMALAKSLGMNVGYVSLLAAYLDRQLSPHDTLLPVGVAMTMRGLPRGISRRPPSISPRPFGMVAPPAPMPIPTGGAFPLPTPPPDIVPVTIPDMANTISATGDVQRRPVGDELRIDIRVESADPNYSGQPGTMPNPIDVLSTLRKHAAVLDAASQAAQPSVLPIGYEVLVRPSGGRQINAVVSAIRAAYRHLNITLRFDASPAMDSCDPSIDSAQAASAQVAMESAVAASGSSHRRLRRLLLAAAYPPNAPDGCVEGATLSPLDRALAATLQIPRDRAIPIDVTVRLVFRTYPPK